jgi:putative Holliday junction resolvase
MAVDWGARRIGLALSDPTRTIASPLRVIEHQSRALDAAAIVQLANENEVSLILMGVTYDDQNDLTPSGRSAMRLAEAIHAQGGPEVCAVDEAHSTRTARQSRLEMGLPRGKRKGHFDAIAAVLFLQTYLDNNQ